VTPSVVPCGYSIPVGGVGVGWAGKSRDGNRGIERGLEGRDNNEGWVALVLVVMWGEVAVVGKGVVLMGPELGVLVDAVALGLALSGAIGDEVGESRDTDDSVGDMLACWTVGWVVGSGVGVVDVLSDYKEGERIGR
jgi:hypothetical protein